MKTLIQSKLNGGVKPTVYISDIHGDIDSLRRIKNLVEYHNSSYNWVFGGDYVDGEPYGLEVLEFIKRECDDGWAKAIIGNHDKMLLDFLRMPDSFNQRQYYMNGGKHTLKHMCGDIGYSAQRMAEIVRGKYPDIVKWLGELPTAIEDPYKLCVHAGVDLTLDDYHDTSEFDALWLRERYMYDEDGYQRDNLTGKVIVTGHTPTRFINGDASCPVTLFPSDSNRYFIDGGEHALNRHLNVLVLDRKGNLEDVHTVGVDVDGKKDGTIVTVR